MGKSNTPAKEGKIGPVKFFSWTVRGISTGANLMVLGYLTMYCTDFLGLNPAILAILLVGSKAIDAVTALAAGLLIDRTNTGIGRGRPYELAIIGLWLCTWLLFTVPASWAATMKYIWVFVMYVMVNAIFLTLLNANVTAYTVRAFTNHEQYVTISTLGFIVPMVGVVIFNIALPILLSNIATTHSGWSLLVGMIAILMTALGLLRFFFVPEQRSGFTEEAQKQEEKVNLKDIIVMFKKDKYILLVVLTTFVLAFSSNIGAGAYYFKYIVGNLGLQSIISIFQMLSIPLAFIIPSFLKHSTCAKLIAFGAMLSAIGFGILIFAGPNVPLLIMAGLLTGVGSVPSSMLASLMLIDISDYHEYIGIPRMEGTVSAVNGLFQKIGSTLATAMSGFLLSISGFVSTTEGVVEQPASAIEMIRALYSYIPAILWILAMAAMLAYKLEGRMPAIREELTARREAAAQE